MEDKRTRPTDVIAMDLASKLEASLKQLKIPLPTNDYCERCGNRIHANNTAYEDGQAVHRRCKYVDENGHREFRISTGTKPIIVHENVPEGYVRINVGRSEYVYIEAAMISDVRDALAECMPQEEER
jgi:hypothetical protein